MTVIIGLVTSDDTYLGCDGQVTEGDVHRSIATPKVFLKHIVAHDISIPVGFGVAGAPFLLNDLRYNFAMPLFEGQLCDINDDSVDEYVLGSVAKALLEEYGEMDRNFGGIIAVGTNLYAVDYAFNAVRSTDPYEVEGDGMPVALGALTAMELFSNGRLDRSHLEVALRVSATRVTSCNDDIVTMRVPRPYE